MPGKAKNKNMSDQLTLDGVEIATPQPEKTVPQDAVIVFCDGACSGNPGPGGWACIVEINDERREFSGGKPCTTNNQMELQALIEGLKAVPAGAAVRVVTDSEYLAKGITLWLRTWARNGWITAAKKPVKNQEQWQEIQGLIALHPVKTEWVRGHAGHPENERCDELARAEIKKIMAH
jgi:ribonuclease HI